MPKLPTIFFLVAGSVLAVVHIIAIELVLYWKYWWFDLVMHFLAGAVLALLVFTLKDLRPSIPERWLKLAPVLGFVLVGGLVWEVYELGIGIPIENDFWLDTSIDIVMDLLGGLTGFFVGRTLYSFETHSM
ncbi:hypothetical protein N9L26_00650 [Candidatus Pacebacteria bacterium]|nr:hypothetical protein [Candidatus Paceibacterota bacterium]